MQTHRFSKTNISLTHLGRVFAEKVRVYQQFPIQDVISYTFNVVQVVGAILLTLLQNTEAREPFALVGMP